VLNPEKRVFKQLTLVKTYKPMKKLFSTLVIVIAISIAAMAQNTPPPATTQPKAAPVQQVTPANATPADNPNAGDFQFTEETWDFNKIPKGTPVNHDFTFTNTGKEPIVISNVQASCGCTTPKWPKEPILPGKTAVINVQYNAANPGGFNKSITITSNAKTPSKVIYIKGTVEAQSDQTTPDKPANMLTTPDNH
jgi:hypothetical protein